jgi:hypothetical protein
MVRMLPKQREDLNQAIFEYLTKQNYSKAAEYFMSEAGIQAPSQDSSGGTQMNSRGGSNLKENVLETKWITLSKMSKKVSDLEK